MEAIYILCICISVLVLLYLLAIMPRVTGKPDMEPFKEWLYAHRGLHDNSTDAPENSMKAFKKAVDAGYGIELDVQLSKDNVPMVFHDFDMKRICGVDGKIGDYTYEELQQFRLFGSEERIPRFEDALKLVDGRTPLIVEYKLRGTGTAVCPVADELLKQYKGMYCIESFSPMAVRWYRKNRPEVVRGQLSEKFYQDGHKGMMYFFLEKLLMNFLGKPDFVAYNHKHEKVLSRRICHKLYKNTAVAWTIRSRQELEEAGKYFDIFIFEGFIPK